MRAFYNTCLEKCSTQLKYEELSRENNIKYKALTREVVVVITVVIVSVAVVVVVAFDEGERYLITWFFPRD